MGFEKMLAERDGCFTVVKYGVHIKLDLAWKDVVAELKRRDFEVFKIGFRSGAFRIVERKEHFWSLQGIVANVLVYEERDEISVAHYGRHYDILESLFKKISKKYDLSVVYLDKRGEN